MVEKKEQFRKWRHSHKGEALTTDFSKLGGNTENISNSDHNALLEQFQESVLDKPKASETIRRQLIQSKAETDTLRARNSTSPRVASISI